MNKHDSNSHKFARRTKHVVLKNCSLAIQPRINKLNCFWPRAHIWYEYFRLQNQKLIEFKQHESNYRKHLIPHTEPSCMHAYWFSNIHTYFLSNLLTLYIWKESKNRAPFAIIIKSLRQSKKMYFIIWFLVSSILLKN